MRILLWVGTGKGKSNETGEVKYSGLIFIRAANEEKRKIREHAKDTPGANLFLLTPPPPSP